MANRPFIGLDLIGWGTVDLVVDVTIMILCVNSASRHRPELLLVSLAIALVRASFRVRAAFASLTKSLLMPLSAGLRNMAPEPLLFVSERRRSERIRQAMYVIRYWGQHRPLNEEELELLGAMEKLALEPTLNSVRTFFEDFGKELNTICERTDASIVLR